MKAPRLVRVARRACLPLAALFCLRAILTLTFAFTNAHDDTRYTSQKSIQLYVTTGTANDWFYDTDTSSTNCVGTTCYRAYGFTIELRDTGLYVAPL